MPVARSTRSSHRPPTVPVRAAVTTSLRDDHALIRRVLAVLRAVAGHVGGGGCFPAEDVAALAAFFREFAEHQHHSKEETLLLATLAAHGAEEAAEGVGELLRDHEETRELLYTLTLFWEPTHALTAAEAQAFAQVAQTYADRLVRHMDREEQSYFPLADRVIPGDEQLDLQARFAAFDEGRRSRASWQTIVAEIAQRWPE